MHEGDEQMEDKAAMYHAQQGDQNHQQGPGQHQQDQQPRQHQQGQQNRQHQRFPQHGRPHKQRAPQQKRDRGDEQCYFCGLTGHWKNECPEFMRYQANQQRQRKWQMGQMQLQHVP
jgi:hypothetical protein